MHLRQHTRFYSCALLGVAVFCLSGSLPVPMRFIAGGNAFFAVYLILVGFLVVRFTPDYLRCRAMEEDEGIFLVVIIMLAIIALCCAGIVTMINQGHNKPSGVMLALILLCAPLGWITLHVTAAFHYANLFYAPRPADTRPPLMFPGGAEPGPWDFLYYAFVVGMTAQVSDVQVFDTKMRRATLGHGVVSFFFNTVLIAMAVNAVVALAS